MQEGFLRIRPNRDPERNSFGRVWFHRADADQASKNAFLDTPLAFGDYLVVAMRAGEAEPGNNKHHLGVFAVRALSMTRQ